jgi:hypothetical protein
VQHIQKIWLFPLHKVHISQADGEHLQVLPDEWLALFCRWYDIRMNMSLTRQIYDNLWHYFLDCGVKSVFLPRNNH